MLRFILTTDPNVKMIKIFNIVCKHNPTLAIVKYFIEDQKCSPHRNHGFLLKCAIQFGNLDIIKYLVSVHNCNTSPVIRTDPFTFTTDCDNAFFIAIYNKHLHVVKYLLDRHIKNEFINTPNRSCKSAKKCIIV